MSSSPRGTSRLPLRPSAEHLRKQAKRLARERAIPLAEAQHALAREYGAQHWAELMHMVEAMLRGADRAESTGHEHGPILLRHGAHAPAEVTPPLLAIHRDDAAALGGELDREPGLARRVFASIPYSDLADATLLHVAADLGASACLRALLERGAPPNARSREGLIPIACAARGGSPDDVRLLLDHGAHGWLADAAGLTPADHARAATANPHAEANVRLLSEVAFDDDVFRHAVALIAAGDVEALAALLAAHPQLVTARVEGDSAITRGYFHRPTLLHFVAGNPSDQPHLPPRIVESARAILDAGAAVDATTGHSLGGTTLALVASSGPGHSDGLVRPLVELLVARGADPAVGLRAAILHRFVDTTRLLHQLGAAPTAVSAAGVGDLDSLRAVLAAGVSADDLVHAGWAAAMNGEAAAIDALVAAGLDVDVRLPRPFAPTMLHEAAWNGQRAASERLLAHGADPTLRDTQFDGTPSGWARHAGHVELADWLAPPA
jgi:hypothetical protein